MRFLDFIDKVLSIALKLIKVGFILAIAYILFICYNLLPSFANKNKKIKESDIILIIQEDYKRNFIEIIMNINKQSRVQVKDNKIYIILNKENPDIYNEIKKEIFKISNN